MQGPVLSVDCSMGYENPNIAQWDGWVAFIIALLFIGGKGRWLVTLSACAGNESRNNSLAKLCLADGTCYRN